MISGLLRAADQRAGGALFIVGGPGMGKTAVLDDACRSAGGFRVVRATGQPEESVLPFGVAEVLGLAPGVGLGALPEGPLLVAVDDLHWADPQSLGLLSSLCRRIADRPVAVIATLRPWPPEAHAATRRLAGQGHASIEHLQALSDAAALEVLGRDDDEAIRLAAGNPLLLKHLAAGGGPFPVDRFAGLPPAGLRCACAAAVLGPVFRPEVAVEVADLAGAEERDALAALTESGLVRPAGAPGEVEFVHPLLVPLLHDDQTAPLQALLHRRAFSALARRGFRRAAADHAIAAPLAGDPEAVDLLSEVGREALAEGAVFEAVRMLQAAVDLAGAGADDELLLSLGAALVEAGRHAEVIEVASRVRRRAAGGPVIQARALRLLGHARYASGQHAVAGAAFDEAVRLAEPADPAVAVESLLLQSVLLALTAGPVIGLPVADRARRLSARAGDVLARRAAGTWGYVALLTGDAAGVEATATAATALDAQSRLGGLPRQAWRDVTMYGAAAKYAERLADAERLYRELGGAGLHGESPAAVAALSTGHAETLVRAGRLAEALDLAGRACAAAQGATHVTATLAMATMAHILLLSGRLEESDEWCARAEAGASSGRREWLALLRIWDLRGMRRLRQGRVAEAAEIYARCWALTHDVGLGEPCVVPWAGHAITAFATARRPEDAAEVIDWLRACAAGLPCRWPRATAAAGQAALDERAGRHDDAGAGFDEALAVHGQVDLPLERAETLIAYGAFLRRRGRVVTARPTLAEAVRVAEAAGAEWLAAEARDELALAGGRRRRASDDPLALTPSEARVARLAAAGAGNRDIAEQLMLSINTVETHLRRVYAKLGIRSRRELIVKFATWDGEDDVISTSWPGTLSPP